MTTRTAALEADLAIIPDGVNIGARTVVARPPSDLDAEDEISVFIGAFELIREYDPDITA